MNNKIKVLVIGGAGYIGSVLTEELLKKNYAVKVLDLFDRVESSMSYAAQYADFEAVRVDVLDIDKVKPHLKGVDVIIPLAALVGAPLCARHPTLAEMLNYESVKNLCESVPSEVLVIYPNTNSGYGIMNDGEDICTEESPLNPISIYGETKVRAEQQVVMRNGIAFRLATVFGSSHRMRLDLMVNEFVYRAFKDGCIVLFEGHFRRNFIHVRDVAGAFIYAIENCSTMKGEVYNLGLSSANLTKIELCEKIKDIFPGFRVIEADIGEDPDKRDYLVSNDKLEATGWRPNYSLDMGIKELANYYKTFKAMHYGNV